MSYVSCQTLFNLNAVSKQIFNLPLLQIPGVTFYYFMNVAEGFCWKKHVYTVCFPENINGVVMYVQMWLYCHEENSRNSIYHHCLKLALSFFVRHPRNTFRMEPSGATRWATGSTAQVETTSSVWSVWKPQEIMQKTWCWTTWRSSLSTGLWCRPATVQGLGPRPQRWLQLHWRMVRREEHKTGIFNIKLSEVIMYREF